MKVLILKEIKVLLLFIKKKIIKKIKCYYPNKCLNDKKAKQIYCWYEENFSSLDRLNQPHSLKPKPNLEQGLDSSILWRLREVRNMQKKSCKVIEVVSCGLRKEAVSRTQKYI